ncbi:hypothetical protein BGZ82_006324 [Podila clonocystis]|nr:hypothetical protein BGZ82_006324 [Podila clonocystis]
MLGIKSYVFPLAMEQPAQLHQQERLMVPIYQLSTPASSCNSLFSPTRSTGSPPATATVPPYYSGSLTSITPRFDTPVINAVFAAIHNIAVDDNLFMETPSIESLQEPHLWPSTLTHSNDDVYYYKHDAPGHQGMEQGKESEEATHKDDAPRFPNLSTKPLPPCPTSLSPEVQSQSGQSTEASEKRPESGSTPRTSLMSDIRSRTHSVLRRAGFSIAPEAGLYKMTRQGQAGHGKDRMDPNNLVVSNLNTTTGSNNNNNGIVGRPRSRSIRERWLSVGRGNSNNSNSSQPTTSHTIMVPGNNNPKSTASTAVSPTAQASPTGSITSSTGLSFISVAASTCSSTNGKVDRLRPWNFLTGDHGQRQRCNSGPARHSDPILAPQIHSKKSLDHSLLGHNSTGSISATGDRLDIRDLSLIRSFFATRTSEEVKKRRHLRQVSDTTNLHSSDNGADKSFFFGVGGIGGGGSFASRGKPSRDNIKNRLSMVQCLPPPLPPSPGKITLPGGGGGGGGGGKGSDAGSINGTPKPRLKSNWFGMAKRQSYPSSPSPVSSAPMKEDAPKSSSLSGNKVSVKGPEDYEGESEAEKAVGPRCTPDTTLLSITGDQSEKYAAAAASLLSQHQSVNDYGFIYDLEDDDAQDVSGSGSMVGELSTSSISHLESTSAPSGHLWGSDFWAEHEKRAAIRKQEAIRTSELKWIQAIAQVPVDQVKKSNKFKKMIRKGVPTSVRGRVWQFLARADSLRQPGLFTELLSRPAIQPIFDVIERDVHRCYPDHVHFRDGMGGTGQQDLHAILRAYAQYNPRVGYCQGMGRLVGMMLMHMPVEDAFWLLVATMDQYMQEYYTPTLRQLRIDAQVFEQILRAHDPKLAEYLQQNEVMPLMYMTPWFLTLFTMSLPWASVLQVWDIFYFDGVKSLFRVGLAILHLCRDKLMNQCPASEEVMDFLLHVPLEMLGPKPLFEAAFKIRLSKDSVQRMILVTAGSMDAQEREAEMKQLESSKKAKVAPATPVTPVMPVDPVSESGLHGTGSNAQGVLSPGKTVSKDDINDGPSLRSTTIEPDPQPAPAPTPSNSEPQDLTAWIQYNNKVAVEKVVVEVARPRSQPSKRISCFGTPDDPLPIATATSLLSLKPSSAVAAMISVSTSALPSQSGLTSPTQYAPPVSSSTFSGLGGVFRTRKRAGTMYK